MRILISLILSFSLCSVAHSGGCDSNTGILLHGDGTDGSTTFTDEGCNGTAKTVASTNGSPNIDTTYKEFGTASIEFLSATADYIRYLDSTDWDILDNTTSSRGIDLWARHLTHTGEEGYFWQSESATKRYFFRHNGGAGLIFYAQFDGTAVHSGYISEISDSNWHHLAVIKIADDVGIYKDGTQVGYVDVSGAGATGTLAGSFFVGYATYSGMNGNIDEFRVQNSDYFGATPNSTPDDSITVPTVAYSTSATRQRLVMGTTYDKGFMYQVKKERFKLEGGGYSDAKTINYWFSHSG